MILRGESNSNISPKPYQLCTLNKQLLACTHWGNSKEPRRLIDMNQPIIKSCSLRTPNRLCWHAKSVADELTEVCNVSCAYTPGVGHTDVDQSAFVRTLVEDSGFGAVGGKLRPAGFQI